MNILFYKNYILFFFFTILVYFLSSNINKLSNKNNKFVWELELQETNTIFYVNPLNLKKKTQVIVI